MSAASPQIAPWLEAPLAQALALPRAHAVLLDSRPGLAAFDAGLALARAWLCETHEGRAPACGHCSACHLFDQRSHPDAHWLLPALLRVQLGWEEAPSGEGKPKPSKEIRVDEVRALLGFAQSTSGRGRGKVVLIHPAEAMNAVAANALLKTLEEPGGKLRFVLVSEDSAALLPTIRSRCQAVPLHEPLPAAASQWLRAQQPDLGEADAQALLRAAGGRPAQALAWLRNGLGAPQLAAFPRAVARADLSDFSTWTPAATLDLLQRLATDLLRLVAGAAPLYFRPEQLPKARQAAPLHAWVRQLQQARAKADHPLQLALWLEALGLQARDALRAHAAPKLPPMSEDFRATNFAPSQLATGTPTPRPGVIQLSFKEKGALYAAYISAFGDGGLFLPSTRSDYKLGDDVYLLLSLPDDPSRHPVAGKVAWITPPNAPAGRTQGIGVKFAADDKHRQMKHKIEEILGTSISSSKPTQTI